MRKSHSRRGAEGFVPQNGEVNTRFGVYKNLCCGAEIVINIGSTFPDCAKHPMLTTKWSPIVDPEEKIPRACDLPKKDTAA